MIKKICMLALIVSGYASSSLGMEEKYVSTFPDVNTWQQQDYERGTFEKALMQSIIDNIGKPERYFEAFLADLSRFVGQWEIDYDVECWVEYPESCKKESFLDFLKDFGQTVEYPESCKKESFLDFLKDFGQTLVEAKDGEEADLIAARAERIRDVINAKQYAYSSRREEPIPLETFSDNMQIPREKGWWKKHVKPTVLGIICTALTAVIIAAIVHKLRTRKIHRSMRTV